MPRPGFSVSMGVWDVHFRLRYDYPLVTLSKKYSGAMLRLWCIWNREILQMVSRDKSILDPLTKEVQDYGWCLDSQVDGAMSRTFLMKCTCDDWKAIEFSPYDCSDSPPASFTDGWGYYRAIAFEEANSRKLLKAVAQRGELELLQKRELPLSFLPSSVWTYSLFGDLTEKQIDSVLKAHRFGYYDIPRKVSTENVARGLGLSRTTYEEHLRKGENKIMASLMPYLKLYAEGEHPDLVGAGAARD